ncbi:MFS transporter [Streptomyces sp. SYSU K217416]
MTLPDSTAVPAVGSQQLLDRLDGLEVSRPHRRLMFQGGLGYAIDSFDGALMGYALSAVIVLWHISSETAGWLLSAVFFGYLVGALVAGVLADRYGRRRLMIIALLVFSVFSVLMATATTPTELFVWRVLAGVGLGAESVLVAPFIAEFIPPAHRGRFVGRTVGFFAFGYILAGLVAALLIAPQPEVGWRIAAGVTALPVVLLLWWRKSLPESPRFLLSQGRVAEAAAVIERFEKESGRSEAPSQARAAVVEETPPSTQPTAESDRPGVLGQLAALWAGPMARRTAVLWVLWFTMTGVNYGFASWLPALLVQDKGFSITTSFVYSLATACAQVPGYYAAASLIDRFERKWVIAGYATGAALSALGVALATHSAVLLVAIMFLSAFVSGAAAAYYAYTVEQYPTEIRTTGTGAASAVARIGAIISPIAIGYLYKSIGFSGVFLCLVGALAVAVTVTLAFGERTAGRSLEQIAPPTA